MDINYELYDALIQARAALLNVGGELAHKAVHKADAAISAAQQDPQLVALKVWDEKNDKWVTDCYVGTDGKVYRCDKEGMYLCPKLIPILSTPQSVAEELKLYQLIIHVFRTHYESDSDSNDSVLMSALSKDMLIDWYNKNLKSTGYRHAKPFPEGCESVKFPGNTGGGCLSVSCTVYIKEVPVLSAGKETDK